MDSRIAASAVVLAGGRSSRMGESKPALRFGTATLLERVVFELATAFEEIVVVASPEGDVPVPGGLSIKLIRDKREYEGPVAALALGLRSARYDVAFGCACDLPMLSARVAAAMVSMLGEHDAVVAQIAGILQPLHAAYRRRCARTLEAMAARGETRLQTLVTRVRALKLPEAEMRAIDPHLVSFANINTPEDYRRALARAGLTGSCVDEE